MEEIPSIAMYANDGRICAGVATTARLSEPPVPPHVYFVGSAVFHYLGPAFAVLLFARVDVLGVAWLRIASAALVFAAWRRPWRAARSTAAGAARAWGACSRVMNCCFYLAIDRLPLGTVAAIEFLPVIVLAALGARTPRNAPRSRSPCPASTCSPTCSSRASRSASRSRSPTRCCSRSTSCSPPGRAARRRGGIDGLARVDADRARRVHAARRLGGAAGVRRPVALRAGIGVGDRSSVIPYVCDQLAMARLARATYALMVSLLPATATVIGIVVLAQIPSRSRSSCRARDRRRGAAPRAALTHQTGRARRSSASSSPRGAR
jgi:inner membrane transporter RhtA